MRWGVSVFVVFAALVLAPAASAQRALTLEAARVPTMAAEINGRPVQLEVDLRFPRGLALSTASAQRLRVQRVPFVNANIAVEGGGSMRTRLARPRIVFGEEDARAFAVIAPSGVSQSADGVIGPGVLPYDIVTITLAPEQAGARVITFPLEDADEWSVTTDVGGHPLRITFDLANDASVFNRAAARLFDNSGAIVASGELSEQALILGLSTLMQPVQTALRFAGLPLAPAFARTNAPLLGAAEPDAIVVTAEGEGPEPALIVGRAALANCSSISVDRRTRRLTLRCV